MFVRVENVASRDSVLVEKERFKIAVNSQADGSISGDVKHDSAAGEAVMIAAAVTASSPLILIGASMISTADEIRHTFIDKEFRNQSLSQGRAAQGFVYCKMADRKTPVKYVTISLQTRSLQTEQSTTWEFLVDAENNLK